jgi:hypothetical protein
MTDRIQELMEQCWDPGRGIVNPRKLAYCVIKEYEKLLPETCPWNGPKDSPMKGQHVAFVARKHFGIQP